MIAKLRKYVSLIWQLDDDQYGHRSIWNPSWDHVLEKLKLLEKQGTGNVRLDASDNDGRTPDKMLTVAAHEGYFQIAFDDVVNGERVPRFIFDETKPVGILDLPKDDDWDERCITRDFKPIYAMFKEFLETQSVTSPLLTWPPKSK